MEIDCAHRDGEAPQEVQMIETPWVYVGLFLHGRHGVFLQISPWQLAHQVGKPTYVDDVLLCDDDQYHQMKVWRAPVDAFSPRCDTGSPPWATHQGELWLDSDGCVQLLDAVEQPLLAGDGIERKTSAAAWQRLQLAYANAIGVPGSTLQEVLPAVRLAARLFSALTRPESDH